MKPLLIGQAPSRNGADAFTGRSGAFLAYLAGMPLSAFLSTFDRVNLLPAFPGRDTKGDFFPMRESRLAAQHLTPSLRGRTVVMVGLGVAGAFRIKPRLLRFQQALHAEVAVCPHPSGINRWWNDMENKRAARRFWCELAQAAMAST